MNKKFYQLLKGQRYNFTTIAEALGVSRATVYNWAEGRHKPDAYKVKQMSQLLDHSIDEVIACFKKEE